MATTFDHARCQYLTALGIPYGFASVLKQSAFNASELRLWLLDNSSFMTVKDSHRIILNNGNIGDSGVQHIQRLDGMSRWEELQSCVAFHAEMAMRCWIPSKFCLINDPATPTSAMPQKFNLCCASPSNLPSEMHQIKNIMTHSLPTQGRNPLTQHMRNIQSYISNEASRLRAQGKQITLIICTQGLPTDDNGNSGPTISQEFQQTLYSFAQLPVKVVIRLCTDDERAVDFYNRIDSQIPMPLDVLDDFWGEALEVYLHNPWLCYGLGLHRLREGGMQMGGGAGTGGILDCIDERPLRIDEIYQFCSLFFMGRNALGGAGPGSMQIELPDPRVNWNAFLQGLSNLLQREKLQWNPVLGKPTPWISVSKLNSIYGRNKTQGCSAQQHFPSYQTQPQSMPTPHANAGYGFNQQQQYSRQQTNFAAQSNQYQQPQQSQQHSQFHCQPNQPPNVSPPPATTSPSTPVNNGGRNDRSANNSFDSAAMKRQILQTWALEPPQYQILHPLPKLLVTVPITFPPKMSGIEPHEYFGKWKPFSEEAFVDEGNGQNALLKRAVRKAKFFLHPDKLPKDLTEKQSLLFKILWDVIHDSWESMNK